MRTLAYLLPLLLLLAPLFLGRYLGEQAIARLRERAAAPRRRAGSAPRLVRPSFRLLPRGSALLSGPIGGRPPPLPAR